MNYFSKSTLLVSLIKYENSTHQGRPGQYLVSLFQSHGGHFGGPAVWNRREGTVCPVAPPGEFVVRSASGGLSGHVQPLSSSAARSGCSANRRRNVPPVPGLSPWQEDAGARYVGLCGMVPPKPGHQLVYAPSAAFVHCLV